MPKTTGSITTANRDTTSPLPIPEYFLYSPPIKREYSLTYMEALIYAFLYYYMSNGLNQLCFTNEQMAVVFDCSQSRVNKSVKTLKNRGLILELDRVRLGRKLVWCVKQILYV